MKNQVFKSEKKYKFNTDLLLLKNGQLLGKFYDENKKSWEQYIINEHSSYMEAAANKSISFQKGVLLKTFLNLFEPYISMYNIICSGWLKPLFKEYKKNKGKINKLSDIRYLEVSKIADFSLHQLDKTDISIREADFDIYTDFYGIGKKSKKEKENIEYSLSMSSIACIDTLPLKINTILKNGISLTHYPYHSGKINFQKTEDGMYRLVNDQKDKNHRYFYNLNELLSKELSNEYKKQVSFPEISVYFSLGEVLHTIIDDMTFYGLGKEREDKKKELGKIAEHYLN